MLGYFFGKFSDASDLLFSQVAFPVMNIRCAVQMNRMYLFLGAFIGVICTA